MHCILFPVILFTERDQRASKEELFKSLITSSKWLQRVTYRKEAIVTKLFLYENYFSVSVDVAYKHQSSPVFQNRGTYRKTNTDKRLRLVQEPFYRNLGKEKLIISRLRNFPLVCAFFNVSVSGLVYHS